jgi:hypothetical protein
LFAENEGFFSVHFRVEEGVTDGHGVGGSDFPDAGDGTFVGILNTESTTVYLGCVTLFREI